MQPGLRTLGLNNQEVPPRLSWKHRDHIPSCLPPPPQFYLGPGHSPCGLPQYPSKSSLFPKALFFTRPPKWIFYNMKVSFVTLLIIEKPSVSLWSSSSLEISWEPLSSCSRWFAAQDGKLATCSWVPTPLCGPLPLPRTKCLPHLFFFFGPVLFSFEHIHFVFLEV